MSVMKRLADARTFGCKFATERYTGVNTMQLCKYSKSMNFRSDILSGCPLGLTTTEARKCPCRNRLYHQGPQDLRVLSCCFPRTWRGDEIRDAEAFAGSLKASPKERKPEVTEETKPQAPNPAEKPAADMLVPATAQRFSLASRIADPLSAICNLGKMLADSKMMGCSTPAQGQLLAMHCLTENVSPLAILREFHLIGGHLTMKADVMLAKFRQAGGSHEIVERSPERAAIELAWKRKKQTFEFTWDQAKTERYVYGKDGKTPKDNWSTPRRRMQMLWARLVSDAVRAVAPECVAGHYTPEDLGVNSDLVVVSEDNVIDAEFEVVQPAEAACDESPGPPFVAEAEADSTPPPSDPIVAEVTARVTREQLQEMAGLKKELEYGDDVWKKVLDNRGVKTAHDFSHADAERVLTWLHRRKERVAEKNELNGFVDRVTGQTTPPAATTEG